MGTQSDIYDAELHAVFEFITQLKNLNLPPMTTYICIDKKATIESLQNNKYNSEYAHLAASTASSLRTNGWNFYIAWTPAHQNIFGNELADQMDKSGAANTNDICLHTCTTKPLLLSNAKKIFLSAWSLEHASSRSMQGFPPHLKTLKFSETYAIFRVYCSQTPSGPR
jgi:hypothetical protein